METGGLVFVRGGKNLKTSEMICTPTISPTSKNTAKRIPPLIGEMAKKIIPQKIADGRHERYNIKILVHIPFTLKKY